MTMIPQCENHNLIIFKLITFLFVTVLGLGILTQASSNVTAMYLLGDSSVDCGLNTLFYPLLHRNLSILPCNGDDASLLPHFLAEKIGLPFPEAVYSQNGSTEGMVNGINFGSAQATIISNSSSESHQSLNQQLRQVLDTIQLLRLRLGPDTARHFLNSSIFYLSFGQMDLINLLIRNSSSSRPPIMSRNEFARVLVNQMSIALRNLYDADARKIICMGIIPLGCSPRVVALSDSHDSHSHSDERGCVKDINEIVKKYNKLMKKEIVKLNAAGGEAVGGEMVFCDAYKGMMEMLKRPWRYGFQETKSACC